MDEHTDDLKGQAHASFRSFLMIPSLLWGVGEMGVRVRGNLSKAKQK
jgi:hypothetical protein